ncbi:MAG: UDP-glucose/GDP-mannose dehydrogenase family protein [Deltaproteobacteria bacterium]|nr:UDP-glucose/GDP-mannose dehydrogenase family protein [Deltaproteobacteria bacterium]
MIEKITEAVGGELQGKVIGVLGLSFKPETDDMRDAPSIDIIAGLQEAGAQVRAFDPVAMDTAAAVIPGLEFCEDSYGVAEGADALVIMTEWNQFRMLDLERIHKLLRQPVLIDLRNVYDPAPMREQGFHYVSVGR